MVEEAKKRNSELIQEIDYYESERKQVDEMNKAAIKSLNNLVIFTKQKQVYLERSALSYAYWHRRLSKGLFAHRLVADAGSFIGADLFALGYQHGFSLGNGAGGPRNKETVTKEQKDGVFLVAIEFKRPLTESQDHLSGAKKLGISGLEEEEEISQVPETGRMNANLVFGNSMDSKIFDLPVNDKLYKSKYKHLVKDCNESFPERESLFQFFKSYTISDEERKQLWRIRIGNSLNITKELYNGLCLRLELEGIKKQYQKLIADDLFRTLPNYGSTKAGESMYQKLHHILSVFQLYRPDIGYVQGMSFLVVMLYYFYDEFETFSIFSNLIITKPLISACYDFDLETMDIYKSMFTSKLGRKLPKVKAALDKHMISTDAFMIDWMYTIYSKSFGVGVTRVLWDLCFVFGDYYLIRIAYSIFSCLKKDLQNGKNLEDGFRFIRTKAGELRLSKIVQHTLREVKTVPQIHAILQKHKNEADLKKPAAPKKR